MSKKKIVCVIDDDPIQIFLMKKNLSLIGGIDEVIQYQNGKEAFDGLSEKHKRRETLPDVIFLDLNMPIWDGWIFYNEFAKLFPDGILPMKVFILTSSNNDEDIERAQSLNLEKAYIRKPVGADVLQKLFE